jgi:hypothetical protein
MSLRKTPRSANRPIVDRARQLRTRVLTGVGVSAFAALLIAAAPFASAYGTISFTAPYTTFTSSISNYLSSSGCTSTAHESVTPAWSAASGTFNFGG